MDAEDTGRTGVRHSCLPKQNNLPVSRPRPLNPEGDAARLPP